jgi:hypothetical protein
VLPRGCSGASLRDALSVLMERTYAPTEIADTRRDMVSVFFVLISISYGIRGQDVASSVASFVRFSSENDRRLRAVSECFWQNPKKIALA